jgi:hypothetical protein
LRVLARSSTASQLQRPWIMATTPAIEQLRFHRSALQIGALVGLAILVVTPDSQGVMPYALLGLALLVAAHGYFRHR